MELDRKHIEKRDFPQARRGYDPAEVDRHLRAIADAVDELRRDQPQQQSSLAGAAGSRVEAIIAAAEASAREIEEKARADAGATLATLKGRAEELQREVDDFVARMADLKGAVDSMRAAVEIAPVETAAPAAPVRPAEPAAPVETVVPEAPEPPVAVVEEAVEQIRKGGGDKGRPSEGARLIALNMALSGTPREETARYLRENFNLDDQDELLDDVYARASS